MTSRLDTLLSQVSAPPLPAGLADRVAAAVTILPQESRPVTARRATLRDRRGAWMRRPLIAGAVALGLAFSGAVAATLAGVSMPPKVAAVIAELPFVGRKAPEPERGPIRHAASRPVPRQAPVARPAAETARADPNIAAFDPARAALRRTILAERIIARREARGLPTPPARQIERMIHRREMMRRWRMATPEQRQAFAAAHPRAAAAIEAREARRAAAPESGEAYLEQRPQARARWAQRRALRDATPEQREAFFAVHPRARAWFEARQARRAARLAPPGPD